MFARRSGTTTNATRPTYKQRRHMHFIAFGIIILIMFGIVAAFSSISYIGGQTLICTVQDKDRTRTEDGGSDSRVYTEECGVLSVKDMIFAGEFNSADTYNSITVGETYTFTTTGKRIGILSQFPVIRSVTPTS
jgi:hypothetical protein